SFLCATSYWCVCLKEEERKAENVAGIIGESVTFQLNFSEPFKSITLQRKKKQNFNNVAILKLEKNYCAVTEIFFTSFEERLDVSEDCKRIKIFHLTQEDSATFRAEIPIPQKDEPLNLFFNLQVFSKYLLMWDFHVFKAFLKLKGLGLAVS
uniref:Uncharacterized protein n=1 Tax=Anolis carolinensis TaxID=28377 RepID=A0A803TGF2_ANOCA